MPQPLYLSPLGLTKTPPDKGARVSIYLEKSLSANEAEILGSYAPDALLVCDHNTYEAAGKRLHNALGGKYHVFLLPAPRPDKTTVEQVREAAKNFAAIIAVGSGVINDICKYASFLEGRPYLTYATALSMNGYVSQNASIIINGYKKSLQAHMPKAVLMDLSVLAAAPKRLTLSGLGDSICRSTAQADWLLSHLLFNTPYSPRPFDLLKPYEEDLYSQAKELAQGNLVALELLAKTLLLSGMGMVMVSGSYPASQGEHLIAHTMEIKHGQQPSTHGEQIAVTTLTMCQLQHFLLEKKPALQTPPGHNVEIRRYFGAVGGGFIKEYNKKLKNTQNFDFPLEGAEVIHDWKKIKEKLSAVMQPVSRLHRILQEAGCPTKPEDIGWQQADYQQALSHACYIRNRFTFLDLAKMNGYV